MLPLGSTEIRTRVTGFKVLGDNQLHYGTKKIVLARVRNGVARTTSGSTDHYTTKTKN